MSLLTVIGIGNRLYCDDGIGNDVVEALSVKNSDSRVTYVVGETDVDWVIPLIKTKHIIIIDAVKMGENPGTIHQFSLGTNVSYFDNGISMHNCHLINSLRIDFSGLIIGIEPYELSLKFDLSGPIMSEFELIVAQSNKIIQNYIAQL